MFEQALKIIAEFNDLPETNESLKIKTKYLQDSISPFEFFSLANDYLQKYKELNNGKY